MSTGNNAPGMSPVYAIARDMLATLDSGADSVTVRMGNLIARAFDMGGVRILRLGDDGPLHPDTLALWAVAFGQPTDAWQVDSKRGGCYARLEWATDGEALPEGSRVTWIGGKP